MKVKWPWGSSKPEVEEGERERLRGIHDALTDLEGSAGWSVLRSLIIEEAQGCMTALLEKSPERDRDYLASRIQTLNWILDLPKNNRQVYAEILSEVPDHPEPEFIGEQDGLSPVPKD